MPSFLDFGDDDDEAQDDELKFGSECRGCRFAKKPRICRNCEVGELYEESDPEGVDSQIRERSAW